MSCEAPRDVFQCDFCECQFEADVADRGPDGEPRCPQCGISKSHLVAPGEVRDFVVTVGTKFR